MGVFWFVWLLFWHVQSLHIMLAISNGHWIKGKFSSGLDGTSVIWLICKIKRNWFSDLLKNIILQEEIKLVSEKLAQKLPKFQEHSYASKLQGILANYYKSMEQRSKLPPENSHTVIGQRASACDALSFRSHMVCLYLYCTVHIL